MLAAIALDFILWLLLAFWTWTFRKEKFMSGLKKEMTFVIAIILWNIADYLIFHAQVEWWFQNLFIVYIGVNELLSSLKHLARMWFKTPTKIINRLEKARDDLEVA
jgi:phage-related holin